MTDEETEQELNEPEQEESEQEESEQEESEQEESEQEEPVQEEQEEVIQMADEESEQEETEEQIVTSPVFSKRAAIMSPNWRRYRVLLTVLLDDDISYSQTEIDSIIHTFLDRVV